MINGGYVPDNNEPCLYENVAAAPNNNSPVVQRTVSGLSDVIMSLRKEEDGFAEEFKASYRLFIFYNN